MRAPSRLVLAILGVVAIVVVGAVSAVVAVARMVDPPSPTTTVVGEDGQEVVLDWADYPAHAYLDDPQDVLDAPRAEEVDAVGEAELDALEAAVAPVAPGLDWTLDEDAGETVFPPSGGNGYGGPSLHAGYNSPSDVSSGLDEAADWHAIAAALDAELAALGYEPIAWYHDRQPYVGESSSERDADVEAQSGSLDVDEMWRWSGTTMRGAMWISIDLWDLRRDTAPEDAWPETESGITLQVGGTVLLEDDEQAYVEGIAPFAGLPRPEPSHPSD